MTVNAFQVTCIYCCCCNVDLALRLLTADATIDVSGTSACAASPQPNVNVDLQFVGRWTVLEVWNHQNGNTKLAHAYD